MIQRAKNWNGWLELDWMPDALTILKVHRFLALVGPPAGGKTTFARAAALELTGKEPIVVPCSPELEQTSLWGLWTLAGGELKFADGLLARAIKESRWVVFEEFNTAPLEVRSSGLLQLRGATEVTNPLNGEVLPVPPADADDMRFRVVLISNPDSAKCQQNGLAHALMDDVITLEVPSISAQVKRFLKHNFDAPKGLINRTVRLWRQVRLVRGDDTREEAQNYITFRAAGHLLKCLQAGMDEKTAVRCCLVNKFMYVDDSLYHAALLKHELEE